MALALIHNKLNLQIGPICPKPVALKTNSMPGDDGGKDGGKEGGQQEGGAKQGGRVTNMTFPELMCCMWAALGTNERFSAGAPTTLRLSTSNAAYT